MTEPGSRAQRRGWRRWLPGSREGGIKRLLRHVALPLTGPLLLLLLPPRSSPPRRLRQQRPAPGTRQPPGRGSPLASRQLRSRTNSGPWEHHSQFTPSRILQESPGLWGVLSSGRAHLRPPVLLLWNSEHQCLFCT